MWLRVTEILKIKNADGTLGSKLANKMTIEFGNDGINGYGACDHDQFGEGAVLYNVKTYRRVLPKFDTTLAKKSKPEEFWQVVPDVIFIQETVKELDAIFRPRPVRKESK